jgi:hypothetical protein
MFVVPDREITATTGKRDTNLFLNATHTRPIAVVARRRLPRGRCFALTGNTRTPDDDRWRDQRRSTLGEDLRGRTRRSTFHHHSVKTDRRYDVSCEQFFASPQCSFRLVETAGGRELRDHRPLLRSTHLHQPYAAPGHRSSLLSSAAY